MNIKKISAVFLLLILLQVPLLIYSRHIPSSVHSRGDEEQGMRALVSESSDGRRKVMMKKLMRGETVEEVAGSRLPDCSHACGSCSPCRLVMVSFVCASLQGAETCPMTYKCMCHDKSYPVP